jgi:hypothetical protein
VRTRLAGRGRLLAFKLNGQADGRKRLRAGEIRENCCPPEIFSFEKISGRLLFQSVFKEQKRGINGRLAGTANVLPKMRGLPGLETKGKAQAKRQKCLQQKAEKQAIGLYYSYIVVI